MLRRILGCFVIAALLWQAWPPRPALASEQKLVIGEVAWAGSPLSNADEWVELWNLSNESISLDGYRLEGASSDPLLFDETHVIEAKSAFLIANYAADHENAAHSVEPNLITTAVSLSNSSLHLTLIGPDGFVLDEVGDGGAPSAGSSVPKASMIRSGAEWTTAELSENFYADIDVFGTPGICDGCAEAIEPESAANSAMPEAPEEVDVLIEETTSETHEETNEEAEIPTASVASPSPQFPEVRLSISGSFVAGQKITFDASSSSDPNGDIVYFTWNFGDGRNAEGPKATHTYETEGDYPFELIVSDTTFRTFATTTLAIKPRPLPPPEILLNEIHPAPEAGQEWIELYGITAANLPRLVGWTIEDASGVIFRFTSSSLENIQLNEPLAVIELSSSKLNNTGDSVLLMRADGSLADGVAYDKTDKGMSWVRFPDGIGEWRDAEPSKLEENRVIELHPIASPAQMALHETATNESTPNSNAEMSIAKTSSSSAPQDASAVEAAPATRATKPEKPSVAIQKISKPSARESVGAKIASVKQSSSKTDDVILQTSIDQIMTIPSNTIVELSGIVGSKPGHLGKHQFVLLAPNGRGIYVRASNRQPSPEYGARVKVIGTLMSNDDGVYIRMGVNDRWTEDPGGTTVKVRSVNFDEVSDEDNWSLVQASGYVIESSKTKALIDTGNGLLAVNLSKLEDYRAARIKEQDQVQVIGLLEISDEMTLLPREAAEVEILEHGSLAAVDEASGPSLPGWIPFGAAGLTVAATEGVKRLRKWRYEQKVQELIKNAKD